MTSFQLVRGGLFWMFLFGGLPLLMMGLLK